MTRLNFYMLAFMLLALGLVLRLAGKTRHPVARDQRDPVDEQSEQSFPASDPPSYSVTGTRLGVIGG